MKDKLSVLISSCDKFSDLWDENIKAYRKQWQNNECDTFLVTDKKTDWSAENVNVIAVEGQNDFPLRIKAALENVKTPYVLVTLDDYFLIKPVENDKINYLVDRMIKEDIQYLSLYSRRTKKENDFLPLDNLVSVNLSARYAVNLYPAIWNVEFLKKTVKEDVSPWQYEASLTKTAFEENANCKNSLAGTFEILDVVRKGKVLHKAQKYFKKNNINIGDRPSISYAMEFKLWSMEFLSHNLPKPFFKFVKNIAKKCGMKFYSE